MGIAVDLVKGALGAHRQQGVDVQTSDLRAIKRGALIAGTIWLGLSAEIVVVNVVLPSPTDDDAVSVLISYLCIFAALFLTGMLAAHDGAGRKGQVLAGLIAGSMIGALTAATAAIVDNVWLEIVAQQQSKDRRIRPQRRRVHAEYINQGLIRTAVFLTLGFGSSERRSAGPAGSSAGSHGYPHRSTAAAARNRRRACGTCILGAIRDDTRRGYSGWRAPQRRREPNVSLRARTAAPGRDCEGCPADDSTSGTWSTKGHDTPR